ncbi:MAG: hypothetical protein NC177_01990 [Ruminococcus flavefaciens]|nr:hypothetical protein [Ruminococcus flavefaciens]
MDSDIKLGWFYLIMGLIFLFILIYFQIRDIIRGVKSVNGIVIGENPNTNDIHIRYKIKANTYHEVSCPRYSHYFTLGPPNVDLKIVLKVRKDNPYKVVSIYTTLQTKLTSFSKDGIYSNNYVWKAPLILLSLSTFFIATGACFI